jgi:hypothetical protein
MKRGYWRVSFHERSNHYHSALQFPHGTLSHVLLKDRLAGAKTYRRIAGYFRSSTFELVDEEIEGIDARSSATATRTHVTSRPPGWHANGAERNEGFDEIDSLAYRKRYRRLYQLPNGGKVKVQVVSANDAPFLHGKAGVIESREGTKM